jgi:hypothetical protein
MISVFGSDSPMACFPLPALHRFSYRPQPLAYRSSSENKLGSSSELKSEDVSKKGAGTSTGLRRGLPLEAPQSERGETHPVRFGCSG